MKNKCVEKYYLNLLQSFSFYILANNVTECNMQIAFWQLFLSFSKKSF